MRPETLIQKLFAIERAIGNASPAALRAMVIDAQETALRMDLDNLHEMDGLRRRPDKNRHEAPSECGGTNDSSKLSRGA
jgi:hypothetical protein